MDICELAGQYTLSFMNLKAEWYYVEPKGEAGDESLTAAATAKQALGEITAEAIERLEDRRAFWINIYNGAVIERAIAAGVEESVKEVRGFFRGKWLDLAGERPSLDDIEHVQGMNVTIGVRARSKKDSVQLLKRLGLPLRPESKPKVKG